MNTEECMYRAHCAQRSKLESHPVAIQVIGKDSLVKYWDARVHKHGVSLNGAIWFTTIGGMPIRIYQGKPEIMSYDYFENNRKEESLGEPLEDVLSINYYHKLFDI